MKFNVRVTLDNGTYADHNIVLMSDTILGACLSDDAPSQAIKDMITKSTQSALNACLLDIFRHFKNNTTTLFQFNQTLDEKDSDGSVLQVRHIIPILDLKDVSKLSKEAKTPMTRDQIKLRNAEYIEKEKNRKPL